MVNRVYFTLGPVLTVGEDSLNSVIELSFIAYLVTTSSLPDMFSFLVFLFSLQNPSRMPVL